MEEDDAHENDGTYDNSSGECEVGGDFTQQFGGA
jgi:hypothetical protein